MNPRSNLLKPRGPASLAGGEDFQLGMLRVRPSAAVLRLDPHFDRLRGDPEFEKLAHADGK